MLKLGAPYSIEEISAAFSAEHTTVHDFFQVIPDEQFFTAPDGVWTPAENLIHLTQSSKPIALALSLPRTALRLRFGKAKHKSRSLAAIRTEYTQVALAGGGLASGEYVPVLKGRDSTEKQRILTNWQKTTAKIAPALENWREEDLDRLVVPHPLLGKQTIREILFFTLYHNLHHVRDVQRLLDQAEWEWFAPVFT